MIFILLGVGAGILSGIFGIGGGIVIVPSLILMTGMTSQRATGTSLAALLLPVGAFGVWQYHKAGLLDPKIAALIALGMLLGVYGGARFALSLQSRELQRAFAVFLVIVAARIWITAK